MILAHAILPIMLSSSHGAPPPNGLRSVAGPGHSVLAPADDSRANRRHHDVDHRPGLSVAHDPARGSGLDVYHIVSSLAIRSPIVGYLGMV